MKDSTIRFGLIGAGQIAHSSANSINAHPNGTVVAAQDLNVERLQNLCGQHDIPHSFTTAEELFGDKEIDAVYIAVPNKFHAPLAIQALEAGKHVMLEKPFAMNTEEAENVVRTAERVGKAFTVGMNQRFMGDSQVVRDMVEKGRLGEVYHGKAYWYRRTGIPKLGTWFGKKELSGGGCLYDIGVHLLDLCLYTMNNFDPVSVSGATYTKFGNRGLGEGSWGHSDREHTDFDVEDFASAFIRMANGATVTLDVTWACHTDQNNLNDVRLFGTEGGASCYPARLFRSGNTGKEYDIVESPKGEAAYATDRFHNFINYLHGGEELCVKAEEAITVQRILDAIAESCATGREVILKKNA